MTIPRRSARLRVNSVAVSDVTYVHVDEAALVERARLGEREAFGRLYDRHVEAIYRYVSFGVPDPADAEDVTSEVFVHAMLAMPRYEPRSAFRAWLYRIARNVLIDRSRRTARRPQVVLDDATSDGAIAEDPEDDPETYAAERERRETLRRALAKLKRDQQDVIVLHFILQLTADEIAEILGKPASTVRGIQMRALRTLRKHLAPKDLL